ncbi:MAG TPA: hypothetical protein VGQ13_09385 [Nitrososphaera sp.]|nr:hypothetical protein [Nitrososphaera sp.]
MNVALIEKSSDRLKLSLYSESLAIVESESFDDLYTLNFYLQTLAKKGEIEKGLLVVHDKDRNTVKMSIARDENSFFIS